jgi:hypothetical protein
MAAKKKVIRIIKDIDDPKVKDKLLKLFIERDKLMKQKETEQIEMHNKYLPKYLSTKILNAVGFIEYTLQKGKLNMPDMIKFLQTEKKFSQKEIGWVMLLLSLETVEEILGTPEIGGKIQEAIIENRKKTLH